MITQAELMRLLTYNPYNGTFIWRMKRGNRSAGSLAGYVEDNGLLRIRINTEAHYAHRLAWLFIHGECPPRLRIKHLNGDKLDNRILNLASTPRVARVS